MYMYTSYLIFIMYHTYFCAIHLMRLIEIATTATLTLGLKKKNKEKAPLDNNYATWPYQIDTLQMFSERHPKKQF